jgi:hypothetical protein
VGHYKPTGQPSTQRDKLFGGRGRDFTYTSYGSTSSTRAAGRHCHAHDGRRHLLRLGLTVVYMSHQSRRRLLPHGCRNVSLPAGTAVQSR